MKREVAVCLFLISVLTPKLMARVQVITTGCPEIADAVVTEVNKLDVAAQDTSIYVACTPMQWKSWRVKIRTDVGDEAFVFVATHEIFLNGYRLIHDSSKRLHDVLVHEFTHIQKRSMLGEQPIRRVVHM
jgi:hypothetical protein